MVPRPVRPLDERVVRFRGYDGGDERDATEDGSCRRPTCRATSRARSTSAGSAADVFAPDGAGSTADPALPPFTIIQPPPNVTGSLHLGHAQRTAVEDLMIRHARMLGHPTLCLPGLDHASIAAQFVLDGIIATEGESRESLGRERYLERMRAFVDDDPRASCSASSVGSVRRSTGAACGTRWTRARREAVRVAFKRLYDAASPTAPRRSSTGARAAGRASATSR